ncbi:hypothetical protein Tco_0162718 [Tanacetum coccineum]
MLPSLNMCTISNPRHHLLLIIYVSVYYCPGLADYGVVFFEQKDVGSNFAAIRGGTVYCDVELFALEPPVKDTISSTNIILTFTLNQGQTRVLSSLKSDIDCFQLIYGNVVLVKGFGYLECWAFQIRLAEFLLPNPFAKPCRSFVGMDQSGSGVPGLSSSGIGFNHSGLGLIFGRWEKSVSSESDIFAVSCIGTSSTGCHSRMRPTCNVEKLNEHTLELRRLQKKYLRSWRRDEPEATSPCLFFIAEGVFFSLNLVKEEGLDHHVISCGTCPFQQRIHLFVCVP